MNKETIDFQTLAAERILHIYKNMGHTRVLLADEVGLGKTYIARQVINLVRDWHKEKGDDFFRVVYICSNVNIAEQNIGKLGVKNKMSVSESRLSMQHLMITRQNLDIANNGNDSDMPESIIPLTPSTSFKFYSAQGIVNERALMFDVLKRLDPFHDCRKSLGEFLSCGVKKDSWESLVNHYDAEIKKCGEGYMDSIKEKLKPHLTEKLVRQLIECTGKGDNCDEKSKIINVLRHIFAEISIEMLNPDLVIMDEFQRFSDLLKGNQDNEQSLLVKHFFDPSNSNTKILLLSATPYKPYSTLEELNTDDKDEHYQGFMDVMKFLYTTDREFDDFKRTWQCYSDALIKTDVKDITPLLDAKTEAQESLYKVMCRTERFNTGIIDVSHVEEVSVTKEDVLLYAQGQKLMDYLSEKGSCDQLGNMPMEYVKSSPYLLSFMMDNYKIKEKIASGIQETSAKDECETGILLLKKTQINNYKSTPHNTNGKLKFLHDMVFGKNAEQNTHFLLWVPASRPYYKAGGIFESAKAKRFSKILLFSSWEMVPRMVSTMMSYYAEYYTLGELRKSNYVKKNDIKYVAQKKYRYGESRLKPQNPLEYPCRKLSELYDPCEYYGQGIKIIRKSIKAKINECLLTNEQTKGLQRGSRGNAGHILKIMKLLDGQPVEEPQNIYIPGNAEDVLTNIAIGSPAVCAYRQSKNYEDAEKVGKAFETMFNKPESAAIIDLMYEKKDDDDYYVSVLDYCVKGNLQSVLDEYAHMLETSEIGSYITDAMIETSNLQVDTFDSLGEANERKLQMRCHFAIPFIDKAITEKSVLRTKNIRTAFNSPFRPFILSTTSIGQEGLDFHWYARKVVHWNLPSNPVDIEQREGRVNRYKCLAIRRNIAHLYGTNKFASWDDMFNAARSELKKSYSDLVPYWCLPTNLLSEEQRSDLEYVERIVPMYPLSREKYHYEHLIKVLSLYRMTMGQPRQEELLELLKGMKLDDNQLKQLTIDLCPYNKRNGQFGGLSKGVQFLYILPL